MIFTAALEKLVQEIEKKTKPLPKGFWGNIFEITMGILLCVGVVLFLMWLAR